MRPPPLAGEGGPRSGGGGFCGGGRACNPPQSLRDSSPPTGGARVDMMVFCVLPARGGGGPRSGGGAFAAAAAPAGSTRRALGPTVIETISAPSPNFDARTTPPDMIVLHYTGMRTGAEALERLRDPAGKVSAHYLIEEDGRVFALVAEERHAQHARSVVLEGRAGRA